MFGRTPGVLIEPVGEVWAAYSPLSGSSHLINDESAAIIETLGDEGPLSAPAICRLLARDCGVSATEIEQAIGSAWQELVEAGLICEHGGHVASNQ